MGKNRDQGTKGPRERGNEGTRAQGNEGAREQKARGVSGGSGARKTAEGLDPESQSLVASSRVFLPVDHGLSMRRKAELIGRLGRGNLLVFSAGCEAGNR